jgi:hypothetical protein
MRKKKDIARDKNFNCRIEAQLQYELDEIKKVAGKNWSDDVRLFLWGKVEEYKKQNQARVLH